MFELIPSKTMRQILKEDGFEFSDFQKATLIWNASYVTREEKLNALRELASITTDEKAKIQITERLEFEGKAFATFLDNSSMKYIYVVEDHERYGCGFFASYDRAADYAVKYAKKYETSCSIQKYLVVKADEDMIVRNPWKGNPNMGIKTDEFSEYDGDAVAGVSLNENGIIKRLWSNELTKEDENIVDEYKTERFESQFIKIPFEYQTGTPVRDVVCNTYGVLAQGKEDWEKYLKSIEDRDLYVDYSDVQVIVYELTESGYWSHEHINPLHLEIDFPEHIEGDKKRHCLRRATEALGDYLSHKSMGKVFCPEFVIKTAREYAEVCHEKSYWEKIVYEAEKPEDLLL